MKEFKNGDAVNTEKGEVTYIEKYNDSLHIISKETNGEVELHYVNHVEEIKDPLHDIKKMLVE
jgi:hypothetical protein